MKTDRFELRISPEERHRLRALATLAQRSEAELFRVVMARLEVTHDGGIRLGAVATDAVRDPIAERSAA